VRDLSGSPCLKPIARLMIDVAVTELPHKCPYPVPHARRTWNRAWRILGTKTAFDVAQEKLTSRSDSLAWPSLTRMGEAFWFMTDESISSSHASVASSRTVS